MSHVDISIGNGVAAFAGWLVGTCAVTFWLMLNWTNVADRRFSKAGRPTFRADGSDICLEAGQ